MAQKSGFFQANFSAALLRSAALAVALLVHASPARAEPVTLTCRSDAGPATWTFRIDYATGMIEELAPSGKAYANRVAKATVSPNAIIWSIDQPSSYLTGDNVRHQTTEHWEGHINRLSATGWVRSYHESLYHSDAVNITCRQATQKF
jgi:hypothetical protein